MNAANDRHPVEILHIHVLMLVYFTQIVTVYNPLWIWMICDILNIAGWLSWVPKVTFSSTMQGTRPPALYQPPLRVNTARLPNTSTNSAVR